MPRTIPSVFIDMLQLADSSWRGFLRTGLEAVADASPDYLPALAGDYFLPTGGRLFAAFVQPIDAVRYVLVGEGPYPREKSATGVCFMDGAVELLWSKSGLSKPVNRATSLRNFMKMLLVADGKLTLGNTSGDHMAQIALQARSPGSPFIQTLSELQSNLTRHGFLLLNASLVFRPDVPPLKDAKAWQPFLQVVLAALLEHAADKGGTPPKLVLWGKIAEQLKAIPANASFPKIVAEHPYNLTFIGNPAMRELFGPMHLLQKQAAAG
jgi:uracil-DNA glycosylase